MSLTDLPVMVNPFGAERVKVSSPVNQKSAL